LDKTAITVAQAWLGALREYRMRPARIRTDKGSETVLINFEQQLAFLQMQETTGCPNRVVVITGRSVHNTRIERFWRTFMTQQGAQLAGLWDSMTAAGVLNVEDNVDLGALQRTFMPALQVQLDDFRRLYNLRRERGATDGRCRLERLLDSSAWTDRWAANEFYLPDESMTGNSLAAIYVGAGDSAIDVSAVPRTAFDPLSPAVREHVQAEVDSKVPLQPQNLLSLAQRFELDLTLTRRMM